jgi:hypothetical protein
MIPKKKYCFLYNTLRIYKAWTFGLKKCFYGSFIAVKCLNSTRQRSPDLYYMIYMCVCRLYAEGFCANANASRLSACCGFSLSARGVTRRLLSLSPMPYGLDNCSRARGCHEELRQISITMSAPGDAWNYCN